MRRTLLGVLLAGAATAPLGAQELAPVCATIIAPMGAFAAWSNPIDMHAQADAWRLATLAPGQAARLDLLPISAVHFPVPPQKPGAADSHGGLLSFAISQPGKYRIALGSAAWIDVVDINRPGGPQAIPSSAHGYGPACTGIHKTVDFNLAPGRYVLQLSGDAQPRASVLIVRQP